MPREDYLARISDHLIVTQIQSQAHRQKLREIRERLAKTGAVIKQAAAVLGESQAVLDRSPGE